VTKLTLAFSSTRFFAVRFLAKRYIIQQSVWRDN